MNKLLKNDERVFFGLRALYESYGYTRYKVSKFEEYDFFARNRRIPSGGHILTFTDTDGRLMALKPDVTLSIVKNAENTGTTRKVCYSENVYRVPHGGSGFREMMQTGLECIGVLDPYSVGEVIMLASESLKMISSDYVLDVSDPGVITGVLNADGIGGEESVSIMRAFGCRSPHLLASACKDAGVSSRAAEILSKLLEISGPLGDAIVRVSALSLPGECLAPLASLSDLYCCIREYPVNEPRLNFSVVNDMDYYSGIVFRGYINGIASGVLSGGRYDSLLRNMGVSGQAIGFAVYLDQLERFLLPVSECDADVLVLYGADTDPRLVIRTVSDITAEGKTVRAQRDTADRLSCGTVIDLRGGATR